MNPCPIRFVPAAFTLPLCLALLSGCTSLPAKSPVTIRVMTYNIHHGEGLDGKVDLARIADVIKRERADIVALQEVDKGVGRTQRRDLPAELAALTGMSCVFSNNFNYQGGEYGNAVLTRFPILSATNLHYRMLRTGEQRGLLQLALRVNARELVFMNTHIDYRGDDSERWLNVQQIESVAKHYTGKPVIICGDFNDTPGSRIHQRLKESFVDCWEAIGQGEGWSYPAAQPKKRIDYVWLNRGPTIKPIKAAVIATEASDHLPVLIEFCTE